MSMFNGEDFTITRQPSKTWRVRNHTVNGKTDVIEALKQKIMHILEIERYSCPIYDDNFGVEFEQYKSMPFGYLLASIEKTLQDALLQDDRITSVKLIECVRINDNSAHISISVISIFGLIERSVEIGYGYN